MCHSELHLTTCFQPVNGRIQLQVLAAQNLPSSSSPLTQGRCHKSNEKSSKSSSAWLMWVTVLLFRPPPSEAYFVKVEMYQLERVVMKKKTRVLKASGGQCQWKETFHFLLTALDHDCSLSVKLYSRSSVRRKQCLGQVRIEDKGMFYCLWDETFIRGWSFLQSLDTPVKFWRR